MLQTLAGTVACEDAHGLGKEPRHRPTATPTQHAQYSQPWIQARKYQAGLCLGPSIVPTELSLSGFVGMTYQEAFRRAY